jgi:hypothetical protein
MVEEIRSSRNITVIDNNGQLLEKQLQPLFGQFSLDYIRPIFYETRNVPLFEKWAPRDRPSLKTFTSQNLIASAPTPFRAYNTDSEPTF